MLAPTNLVGYRDGWSESYLSFVLTNRVTVSKVIHFASANTYSIAFLGHFQQAAYPAVFSRDKRLSANPIYPPV
jgi:hypothetical protein